MIVPVHQNWKLRLAMFDKPCLMQLAAARNTLRAANAFLQHRAYMYGLVIAMLTCGSRLAHPSLLKWCNSKVRAVWA